MVLDPTISIVIPCFNDALFVEKSILSAVNQTYRNKEVIVVDDGSDIKTKKVLERLKPKFNLLITQSNKGLSAARNAGIEAANGKYILIQDSDDYFDSTFCEKAVEVLNRNKKNYKIVTCQAYRFDDIGIINLYNPKGGNLKNFLFSNCAIGNSLFRKTDWNRIGGYDERMKSGFEDWEFYIRLLKDGGEAFVIREPLFFYRQKKNSMRIRANEKKNEILEYIFIKHKELYVEYFDLFVDHLLWRVGWEEREKFKNLNSLEYRIGEFFLKPLRKLKRLM